MPPRIRAFTIKHVVAYESEKWSGVEKYNLVYLTSPITLNVATLSSVDANILLVNVPVCCNGCLQVLKLELISL